MVTIFLVIHITLAIGIICLVGFLLIYHISIINKNITTNEKSGNDMLDKYTLIGKRFLSKAMLSPPKNFAIKFNKETYA